jgi:hypothetical protein
MPDAIEPELHTPHVVDEEEPANAPGGQGAHGDAAPLAVE